MDTPQLNADHNTQLNPHAQTCLQTLMRTWFDFERRLQRVPIIKRLQAGRLSKDDYRALLLNLRQQVIEGSRWIARSASSFDRHYADVRSIAIGHAQEEHRDYLVLEQDFVAAGGELSAIQNGERNAGSEALHAFLMYRASKPNPIDMIGAMWIIEGLGQKMANDWAEQIESMINTKDATRFMRYHGENDDAHMQKLYQLLDLVCTDDAAAHSIVKTATVVGRLYALQLEEIDHEA